MRVHQVVTILGFCHHSSCLTESLVSMYGSSLASPGFNPEALKAVDWDQVIVIFQTFQCTDSRRELFIGSFGQAVHEALVFQFCYFFYFGTVAW